MCLSLARPLVVLLVCAGVLTAAGQSTAAEAIHVTDQWIRALGGTIPAAGYFTLENDTDAPIRLTGASSPECGSLTLHQTMRIHADSRMAARDPDNRQPPISGAMDMMQPVASLAVPPHGVVRFAPGSYHLMCEGASAKVHPGAAIAVSFHFADGRSLDTLFPVRGARTRPAE